MANIIIVNKSDLNACWSPFQYNNQCNKCDKVLTCKVKSEYHKSGILQYAKEKKDSVKKETLKRLSSISCDISKALNNIS